MDVVETFGSAVERLCRDHPVHGRRLLKAGWSAMDLKFRCAGDRRLVAADRYLAHMMMSAMLWPLKQPDSSALVSIFTPCELIQEAGLHPYNVEAYSSYLGASGVAQRSIQSAEAAGIADTLCSYHRIFIGAAMQNVLPHPRCIVYTNLACDANMLTFQMLADLFDVPSFLIDVPHEPNEQSVRIVAEQLRELSGFIERCTGQKIEQEALVRRVRRSKHTLEMYCEYQRLHATRHIPADLVTPLYCAMANNVLLGTPEEERYVSLLLRAVDQAPPKRGVHLFWMHTIPYWSPAVNNLLSFTDTAQIVACELGQVGPFDFDPEHPFEALASRMVYNRLNGSAVRRIRAGIEQARHAQADGVVWFNHWGCKRTSGAALMAQQAFKEAGIPLLLLDGDSCDTSCGGDAQMATRLGAFLEMLGANRHV